MAEPELAPTEQLPTQQAVAEMPAEEAGAAAVEVPAAAAGEEAPAAGEAAPGRELAAAEEEAVKGRPAAAAEPVGEELGVTAGAAVPETGAPKVSRAAV